MGHTIYTSYSINFDDEVERQQYSFNPRDSQQEKHLKYIKRQERLQESLRNCQIAVVPDPKVISFDLMPKVEFIESDFNDTKKKFIKSQLQMEEAIIRMNMINFHSTLTSQSLNHFKNQKIPKSRALNRSVHIDGEHIKYFDKLKREKEQNQMLLNYEDLEKYIIDFDQDQKQLAFNKKYSDFAVNPGATKHNSIGLNKQPTLVPKKVMNTLKDRFQQKVSDLIKQKRSNNFKFQKFSTQDDLVRKQTILDGQSKALDQESIEDDEEEQQQEEVVNEKKSKNMVNFRRNTIAAVKVFNMDDAKKTIDRNIKKDFVTKMPDAIQQNKFHVSGKHFEIYQKEFLRLKKNAEISILKENKKHEVIQKIADLTSKYDDNFKKHRKISKLLRKSQKLEAINSKRFKRRNGILELNYLDFWKRNLSL